MLFFIGKLFDSLVGNTVDAVTSAAETKIHRETVGKVEAKIGGAEAAQRQKAMRSVDKAIDKLLGKVTGKK